MKYRDDGFYKVKFNGKWVVAEFVTNADIDSSWCCWKIAGTPPPKGSWGFCDSDFEEINETRLNKST